MIKPELDYWLQWITRDDVDFVYIPITRCATNWMYSQLMQNKFYKIPDDDKHLYAHKKRLVILREPVDRVISGMFISFCDLATLENSIDQKSFENYLNKDMHTISQLTFLPENEVHNSDRYVYFKFDDSIPDKINEYMNNCGMTLEPGSMMWFDPNDRPIGASSKENREKVYSDPKLLNMFRDYLKEDYKLYNSVEWYGTN